MEILLREPVFLYNYPPSLAALSNINKLGWANRFEVYWRGVELGNAFDELTCPLEQQKRLVIDNLEKLYNGLDLLPIDADFISALQSGIPETAGIAIGVERLFSVIMQNGPIQKIMPFNWSDRLNR